MATANHHVVVAEGLVIRPGDKLIIRLDTKNWTEEEFHQFKQDVNELLPGTEILVMGVNGQLAVQRKED